MLIYVFPPHYQLVYINFDISSFSLISYRAIWLRLHGEMAEIEKQFDINCEVPSIPWPARSIFHVGQGRLFLFALPLFGSVGVGIWEPRVSIYGGLVGPLYLGTFFRFSSISLSLTL